MTEAFLNVKELMSLLKICKDKIYDMCERGELPYYRVGGSLRFSVKEIEAWLQSHKNERNPHGKRANKVFNLIKNNRG